MPSGKGLLSVVDPTLSTVPNLSSLEERLDRAFVSGDRRAILRLVREYRRAARRLGHPAPLAVPRVWLVALAEGQDLPARTVRRARRATVELLATGQVHWAARSLAQEGRIALWRQDFRHAMDCLSAARQLAGAASRPLPPRAWAALLLNLALCAWRLGHRDEASVTWQEALEASEREGFEAMTAASRVGVGLSLWAAGDPAAGYVQVSTALNWYRQHGTRAEVSHVLFNAALMLEDFGRWEDALVLLQEARSLTDTDPSPRGGDIAVEEVHAYLALGGLRAAAASLRDAQRRYAELVHPIGARRTAELLLAEGRLLLAQGRLDEALGRFRMARSHIRSQDPPLLTLRVLSELCQAAEAYGRFGGHSGLLEEVVLLTNTLERPGARIHVKKTLAREPGLGAPIAAVETA